MKRNLGPDSELWGRSVDNRLTSIEGKHDTLNRETTNAFKGLNAQVGRLTEQQNLQTALTPATSADEGLVTVTAPLAQANNPVWSDLTSGPSVTFQTPFDAVLLTFGSYIVSYGNSVQAMYGLATVMVDGVVDPTVMLSQASYDQFAASTSEGGHSKSVLLAVTPDTPTTISVVYGYRTFANSASLRSMAEFTNRFLLVQPLRNA